MNLKNAISAEELTSVRRQNERMLRESIEQEKRRDLETTQRRVEWTATPDELKVCTQCGLQLDSVTIAQITANPMKRREHSFCSSFEIEPGVVRGLADLLRQAYGDEAVPLESLRKVIQTYRDQRGFCAVSRIKLAFGAPSEEIPREARPSYNYSTALSSFDNAVLQRQAEKEEAQRKRHSELHSPIIRYTEDGKLQLVSATVAKMMDGLTPEEFRDLIHTLGEEFKSLPVSKSYHPVSAVGSLTARRVR